MSDPTTALATISSLNTALPPNHNRSFLCVQRLMITLVLFFVLIIAVISIAWLILHPFRPVFTLNSLTISNFTLSNSRVNADYDLELSVKNPNKKVALIIDHFHVYVSYQGKIILSKNWMALVKLEKSSLDSLSTQFPKDLLGYSVDKKLFNLLSTDLRKRLLNLTLEVKIRTRFTSEIWPTKETRMKVSCNNLNVEFEAAKESVPGTGKLNGGGEQCRVDSF